MNIRCLVRNYHVAVVSRALRVRHHEATTSVHVGAESVGSDGPVVVGAGPNCELVARILVVLA